VKAEELKEVLRLHKLWLADDFGGARANLSSASLIGADLSGAHLCSANLSDANLSGANLRDANFCGANLSGASLNYANLRDANFCGADLSSASLNYANLSGADLSGANLSGASLNYANLNYANLYDALGNMKQIKTIYLEAYHINYTKDVIQIGCENHSIEDWISFDDKRILEMDGKTALTFWREYKDFIFTTIELIPAES